MKKIGIALLLAAAATIPALSQNSKPFLGRWDLTVTVGDMKYASWLEVTDKAGKLDARAQQRTGNVAPVDGVRMEGQRLLVTVAAAVPARPAEGTRPATPARPEIVWDLTEKGGKLSGVSKQGDVTWQIAGVSAPAMKRAAPAAWGAPEPLFNGQDLTGWQPINNTPEAADMHFSNHWTVKNGELVNEARGSNLRTTRTFSDFKLHVEFSCPPGENSGVYLRGRYEAQVAPPETPAPPSAKQGGAKRGMGSGYHNPYGFTGCIYGMLGPASQPAFKGEWQVYDITLVGRMVTVIFNGVTTAEGEIAGVTGGAIDSNEGEPGPIYLQGDHHGGIRYRNITISQPKK
ncbi:conserved exported hypothetical protein [Candidatus Sulfopaludibacter sp. SbA6]|nr:conserved exported hypothetical protein [Candidatus Sulfopaludibacter sp. SbA6]